jgi:ketosteroid isomerase-like protein
VVPSDRVERLRPIYAEWATGNLGVAAHLLAADLVFSGYSPEGGVTTHGVEEFGRWLRRFLADWDGYRVEADEFVLVDDDTVLVAGRHYGTGKRSGVAVDDPAFMIWIFRGEQVIGLHFHADRESALKAAGLRP